MSDETTSLQSLSKLKKEGKLRYWRGTIEMPESELHAICDEIQEEHDQTIAATLGSDASAARLAERLHSIADEMRSVGASTMTPHELLACYAREVDKVADSLVFATTLGSGTLTAEQVWRAVDPRSVCVPKEGDKEWQAIADELNAELGSGTCEWLPVEYCHAFAGPGWECSNCGYEVSEYEHDFYNCCPICCAKVVKR